MRCCGSRRRRSAAPTSTSSRASTRSRAGSRSATSRSASSRSSAPAVTGYEIGQRVIAGAITPCGQCDTCLDGQHAQCGGRALGGWRLGNTIDGCQAEYVLVPDAMANLAPIPTQLTRRAGADVPRHHEHRLRRRRERPHPHRRHGRGVRAGTDRTVRHRRRPAVRCDADLRASTACPSGSRCRAGSAPTSRSTTASQDPVEAILEATGGRGVDVAIEALGTQATFENCLRVLRPGGVLSSLGVYSGKLTLPLGRVRRRLGDHTVVTTLCPGGKERMRRLMSVLARARRSEALVTHRFRLDGSRRPTICSPISATACSRSRSRPAELREGSLSERSTRTVSRVDFAQNPSNRPEGKELCAWDVIRVSRYRRCAPVVPLLRRVVDSHLGRSVRACSTKHECFVRHGRNSMIASRTASGASR